MFQISKRDHLVPDDGLEFLRLTFAAMVPGAPLRHSFKQRHKGKHVLQGWPPGPEIKENLCFFQGLGKPVDARGPEF